ncbi:hypothetical protein [Idiomarina aquatica]|uniref:Uncharacterized protein n=1 Tax=Idiomarina aquatica TaxID=1327752 RepID=A0AA94EGB1_9GAMM|nr:hypothetical protein [Idiomarina aquatica]RUO44951.1 hypothetical protein CWE23_02680 [Idiomarina aquatica]
MKLDFLKTLQEVQPCGLRAVIEPLDESYPVMAYSDWKELAAQLVDACFVKRLGNGQYTVTPAGKEAIAQGEEFLEQALGSEQEPEDPESNDILAGTVQAGTVQAESASSKPAPEHPWRKPLLASNPITEEVQRKEREQKQADSANDSSMKFYAWTTKADLEKVGTDELLSRHQVLKEHLNEIKEVVNRRVTTSFYGPVKQESLS